MKKIACMIGIAMFLSIPAYAHSPSDITGEKIGQLVVIKVWHGVQDPQDHFVRKLTIKRGSNVLVTQEYSAQYDKEKEFGVYNLRDINPGDTLSIQAECNKIGMLNKDIALR